MPPVELAFDRYGEDGPPLVVMHGLLGAARNWTTLARRLGETFRVDCLDARNHGRSPWAEGMSYDEQAEDVAAHIMREAGGVARVMGHSMGGKTAMALALAHPRLVERLVVADISPIPHERGGGFDAYIDAMRAIDVAALTRRADADAALAAVVPEPAIRAFLLLNLSAGPDGFRWRANLDALAGGMRDILDFPAHLLERRYEGPALFVTGGASPDVKPAHHERIRALFPRAEIVAIEGAGNWLHAEKPDAFLDVVAPFLA